MLSNKTLMVLPGDGVGPEVVRETLRVVDWLAKNKSVTFNIKEGLVLLIKHTLKFSRKFKTK